MVDHIILTLYPKTDNKRLLYFDYTNFDQDPDHQYYNVFLFYITGCFILNWKDFNRLCVEKDWYSFVKVEILILC